MKSTTWVHKTAHTRPPAQSSISCISASRGVAAASASKQQAWQRVLWHPRPVPWKLESAVARHDEAPHTFDIPSARARARLRKGDGVKLLFYLNDETGNAGVERMWATVTEVRPDGYVGRLENQPVTRNIIERGTLVEFDAEHVVDILRWRPRLSRLFRR